jgi:cellulose synthase/poly-beta-1,6-N-acetylglucosamine synthase-like glycosyltransferase
MAKKILIRALENIFHSVKKSPYWLQVLSLPRLFRYIIGSFCILIGIVGIFTPIPAGLLFFIFGWALILGLTVVKKLVFSLIYRLRLHILYGKIWLFWKKHV